MTSDLNIYKVIWLFYERKKKKQIVGRQEQKQGDQLGGWLQ